MKKARVFQSGNSQAIRLPKEFRFAGDYVYMKKVANALILLPEEESWDSLIHSLDLFSEDFMEVRPDGSQSPRKKLFP